MNDPMFTPFTINGVTFPNRIVRSSIGGRLAYYDGSVNPAFVAFERKFARTGVGAIITATITVDDRRWSPIEYPKLSDDRFVAPFRDAVEAVRSEGVRYIVQLGDPGAHTQAGLFSDPAASKSASAVTDVMFGYRDRSTPLTSDEIAVVVRNFAAAARRVREMGADGLEITASKGYLIHQFLNPATNRRDDAYGGDAERRFRLLHEIVTATRAEIGRDFLFGVRLSANDHNHVPLNLRWPPRRPVRDWLSGNRIDTTLRYGRWLRDLGVDYLHISNGFGFVNAYESPGRFPVEEIRTFYNSVRHLSRKAAVRSTLLNTLPRPLRSRTDVGWHVGPTPNLADAARFRAEVGLPVIANGGFQTRSSVNGALAEGAADLVAMARPLLANPDLVATLAQGRERPDRPCSFCNKCSVLTTIGPLGCHDRDRFATDTEMEDQIRAWATPDRDPVG